VPDDAGSSWSRRTRWALAGIVLGAAALFVVAARVPDRPGALAGPDGLGSALEPRAACSTDGARVLRVLQLNIHFGVDRGGDLDMGALASTIEAERADLVSLNEVDQRTQRSRGLDEARELARATGLRVVYGPNLPWQGGLFGNAILSRLPMVRTANHTLPVRSGLEPRGLLTADVRVGRRTVSFSSVHLTDGDLGETSRILQARAVAQLVEHAAYPSIVAGDLNAEPDELSVRILRQHLLDAQELGGSGDGDTVPEPAPERRIDYVLYDGGFAVVPGSTRVLTSSSDHRAVSTELALLPKPCAGTSPEVDATDGMSASSGTMSWCLDVLPCCSSLSASPGASPTC
jgi:endonuclease/exonuclease/phosphatase family metal-dependent hydrolase